VKKTYESNRPRFLVNSQGMHVMGDGSSRWDKAVEAPMLGLQTGLTKKCKNGKGERKLSCDHLKRAKLWKVKPKGVGG